MATKHSHDMAREKQSYYTLSVRLSEQEHNELKQAAAGATLSEFARSRLLGIKPKRKKARITAVQDPKALAQVLAALGASRMPNNLNQIAHAINIEKLTVTPEVESVIFEAGADIKAMRTTLMKALGKQNVANDN